MSILKAATVHAAALLGWSDCVGAIEPGLLADFPAVEGDPTADIGALDKQLIAIGVAIGVAIGAMYGSIGIGIGIALGLAFGAERRRSRT